ncbi:MAG TPA: tetratricopeptide repeat protein [Myxococcota bacterium]|nr:tetratricopeptide repeat protein [Myxococcota bacterium]
MPQRIPNLLDPTRGQRAQLDAIEAGSGPLREEEHETVGAALQGALNGGDIEVAIATFARAYALLRRRLGAGDPSARSVAHSLAHLHLQAEQGEAALAILDALLAEPDLPADARLEVAFGRTQALDGDARRDALLAILPLAEALEGPDSSWIGMAHATLGEHAFAAEDPAAAQEHWTAAVDHYGRIHGHDHDETLDVRSNLAVARKVLGAWEEAIAEEQAIFDLRAARAGADAPTTLGAGHNLGVSLLTIGRHGEGEALLERVFAARLAALGAHDPETAMTGRALSSHYASTGQPERAAALRERLQGALRAMLLEMGMDPSMVDALGEE